MIKFGTGGWRAFIGEEFTKDNVRLVAQALANIIHHEQAAFEGIVIGYDRRFQSDKAGRWFAEVLAANGVVVSFINKFVPTPVVMFKAKAMDCAYSACITASHNPADYNGIKVFIRGGRDANVVITQIIVQQIATLTVQDVKSIDFDQAVNDNLIAIINPMNEFVDSIINFIDFEAIKKANLRVLIDPMFGWRKRAANGTDQWPLRRGRDQRWQNPDFGGLMPSPSAATLYRLKHLVLHEGYDIGIGKDGDADRLGIIDEKATLFTRTKC